MLNFVLKKSFIFGGIIFLFTIILSWMFPRNETVSINNGPVAINMVSAIANITLLLVSVRRLKYLNRNENLIKILKIVSFVKRKRHIFSKHLGDYLLTKTSFKTLIFSIPLENNYDEIKTQIDYRISRIFQSSLVILNKMINLDDNAVEIPKNTGDDYFLPKFWLLAITFSCIFGLFTDVYQLFIDNDNNDTIFVFDCLNFGLFVLEPTIGAMIILIINLHKSNFGDNFIDSDSSLDSSVSNYDNYSLY